MLLLIRYVSLQPQPMATAPDLDGVDLTYRPTLCRRSALLRHQAFSARVITTQSSRAFLLQRFRVLH